MKLQVKPHVVCAVGTMHLSVGMYVFNLTYWFV